ncbi:ECF-type sigma factor [Haliangium sp.]|uniref:ECF-type sigma factor n=1 Tax=Haliangium sp. TaxID=2663208 RepID=UPI003D10FB66
MAPRNGQPQSSDSTLDAPGHELVQRIYTELRGLAAGMLRRLPPGGVTLQPTALVHEAFARLQRNNERLWHGRRHFYRAAALAMRHLLIDRMHAKQAERHGGGWHRTDISVTLGGPDEDAQIFSPEDLLDLDRALDKLQRDYPDLAEIVHFRFYCGLTLPEIAEVTTMSRRTLERRWRFVRGWLRNEMSESEPGSI